MIRLLWWRFLAYVDTWHAYGPPFGLLFLWAYGWKLRPVASWDGRKWRMTGAKLRLDP